METFKTFQVQYPLVSSYTGSNKLYPVNVVIKVDPELCSIDEILGGVDESMRDQLARDIESGAINVCTVIVESRAFGLTGHDSLGMCFVTSPIQLEQDIVGYNSMVENACDDLSKQIHTMWLTLKPLFEV